MKRTVFSVLISMTILMVVFAQLGCQPAAPGTNRAATENPNAAKEVVDTAAIEKEIMRIENDWPRVLKEKDAEAVRRVEADDIVIIYPDGSVGTKAQDVQDVENGNLTADSWAITDLRVKVINNDAAFATGRSIVKNGKVKVPKGKAVDISGEYRWVDTFARRDGQWKLVASVSTPVKSPAGSALTAQASPSPSPSLATSP